MLSAGEKAAAERVFQEAGYDGPVRIAPPLSEDERIFVVDERALSELPSALT